MSLSAQQLVDCSDTYGNKGCEGGTVQNAFQYVHEEGGLCTNSTYPYIGYVSCIQLVYSEKSQYYFVISTGILILFTSYALGLAVCV